LLVLFGIGLSIGQSPGRFPADANPAGILKSNVL